LIQLRGCLGQVLDEFHFASSDLGGWVVLTGNTAGLEKYVDRELILEGSNGDAVRIEGYFAPIPSFEVLKIARVIDKQKPELSIAFTNPSNWHLQTSARYGIKFDHPANMTRVEGPPPTLQPNFLTNEYSEVVVSLDIPGSAYANANLLGGSFTIFVNSQIRTKTKCMQFQELGTQSALEPYVVGKFKYKKEATGGAAMGTWYSEYYFHILQNGRCYELAFELVEFNAHNADTGCNVPLLSDTDNLNLIRHLIARVSFFRQSTRPK
jgi:hypothetical protein